MKIITFSIIMVSFPLCVFAFVPKHSATYYEAIKPEVQEAQRKGAKAKIIYRVVDDDGTPLTNTTVYGQWQNDYPRKTWKETFVTDTNGVFVANEKVGGRFGFYVKRMVIIYLLQEWIFIGVRAFLLSSKMASGNLMGNDER